MGSAPGATKIRKCGKQHSGTNFKTITNPVFTCSTIQPNYRKYPQGNQTGFTEDVAGHHRKIIKKHLNKSRNTTIGHMHSIIQGLKSTKEKPPNIYPEDKIKTNVVFCKTMNAIITKEGNIYSDLCGRLPTTSIRGNKYIYVMYVYDCNDIITTAMKNRSDKDTIRDFT